MGDVCDKKIEENRRNPDTPPPFSAANGNLSKHTLHPSKIGEEGECIRQRSSTQILKKMLLFKRWGATEKKHFLSKCFHVVTQKRVLIHFISKSIWC